MPDSDRTSPAGPTPPDDPELLRAGSFADILSVIPPLIGIVPEDCVVVLPFRGTRTVGGFRIPLPERLRRVEVDRLARGCLQLMSTVPEAGAALVVIYTSATFEASQGIPLLDLGRAVLGGLERSPLGIVDVACVAADGWGRYTDPVESREPRDLSEITASEPGLLARAVAPEPLDIPALTGLPEVTAEECARVRGVLARGGAVREVIPLVERWLEGPPDPVQEARVILLLQAPALRDQTTVQIAVGGSAASAARRRRLRQDVVRAATGETVAEMQQRERETGRSEEDELADATLLMGSGRAPDRVRLERATTALARLAALAPEPARPPILTVLAWCWWARGVATLANVHLGEARRLDPSYGMAQLYESVFAARSVPEWVTASTSRSLVSAAERR